jgi:hypothetical protein
MGNLPDEKATHLKERRKEEFSASPRETTPVIHQKMKGDKKGRRTQET